MNKLSSRAHIKVGQISMANDGPSETSFFLHLAVIFDRTWVLLLRERAIVPTVCKPNAIAAAFPRIYQIMCS